MSMTKVITESGKISSNNYPSTNIQEDPFKSISKKTFGFNS